jgi:hypothetical protein
LRGKKYPKSKFDPGFIESVFESVSKLLPAPVCCASSIATFMTSSFFTTWWNDENFSSYHTVNLRASGGGKNIQNQNSILIFDFSSLPKLEKISTPLNDGNFCTFPCEIAASRWIFVSKLLRHASQLL